MTDAKAPEHALAAQLGEPLTDALLAASGGRASLRLAGIPATLDGGQRVQVVDTLELVLGGAYCHLHQKRAGYAIDPVQALRLLRRRCVEMTDGEFHLALTGLVAGLRDAHTRYVGPVALHDGVATLSGTGVREAFRGRGLQAALIHARLAWAAAQGCTLAATSTLPATPSQRNMERLGFRIAYPKVVMVRGA